MPLLHDIVARKREELAARMATTPLAVLEKQVEPTTRRLAEALKQPGLRCILECKKASPSGGLLRPEFDAQHIAHNYAAFADAVSVLTDAPYFQGSFADLETVRATLSQPLLCKDFVLEPYQVFEARLYGADAVLLMLSVLDDASYRRCAEAAEALSMDIVTEVHNEEELKRALCLGAKVLGINNRNLKTMKVDLSVTRHLAPHIPRDKTIVCESGIQSRADMDALAGLVDAFLVGSRLMKEARLDLAVRELLFGRVKICGLTTVEAARLAYEAGASWGGLIFAPESARCVSETRAREVAEASPLPMVGVFVNEAPERTVRLAHALQLKAVQLHGEETPAYVRALREKLPPGCQVWKAVHLKEAAHPKEEGPEEALKNPWEADCMVLDTFNPKLRGGSGHRFDWGLLKKLPAALLSKVVIAGGINPENVAEAHSLGAYAVDVNSGLECAPGEKSPALVKRLFSHLRGHI